jgi:hypothetical protein
VAGKARDCSLPQVDSLGDCGPIWIGKFDPTGSSILFATYIGQGAPGAGGLVYTSFQAARVGRDGNIVVLSATNGNVLPTINALQAAPAGELNLHVLKLAADGAHLIYAARECAAKRMAAGPAKRFRRASWR